jgi:hypothetical protein
MTQRNRNGRVVCRRTRNTERAAGKAAALEQAHQSSTTNVRATLAAKVTLPAQAARAQTVRIAVSVTREPSAG